MTKARDNSAGRLNAESVNGLMVGSFKNRLLNPSFAINQRGAATLVGSGYFVDRWRVSQAGTTQTYGVGSPSTVSDTGYSHLYMQTTTVKTVLAVGDYNFMGQQIEGFNVSDFKWGSAAAEPATLSFKAQASQANTVMSVCIRNPDGTRSYVTTVLLQTTLQEYSLTIPGDTAGTWNKNFLGGIDIGFTFAAASSGTYTTSVKDAWQGGNYLSHSTQSNCLDTLNRTIAITDVQFERGTRKTKFEVRPYPLELLMCQRYFWRRVSAVANESFGCGHAFSSTGVAFSVKNPVTMRATPTVQLSNMGALTANGSYVVANSYNVSWASPEYLSGTLVMGAASFTAGNAALLMTGAAGSFWGGDAEL